MTLPLRKLERMIKMHLRHYSINDNTCYIKETKSCVSEVERQVGGTLAPKYTLLLPVTGGLSVTLHLCKNHALPPIPCSACRLPPSVNQGDDHSLLSLLYSPRTFFFWAFVRVIWLKEMVWEALSGMKILELRYEQWKGIHWNKVKTGGVGAGHCN